MIDFDVEIVLESVQLTVIDHKINIVKVWRCQHYLYLVVVSMLAGTGMVWGETKKSVCCTESELLTYYVHIKLSVPSSSVLPRHEVRV
jgi:hypothetical protein